MAELTAPSPPPTPLPPAGHRSTTPLVRMSLAWDNPSRISPAWIALLEFPSCVSRRRRRRTRAKITRGKSDGITRGINSRGFLKIEINGIRWSEERRRNFAPSLGNIFSWMGQVLEKFVKRIFKIEWKKIINRYLWYIILKGTIEIISFRLIIFISS